MRMRREEDPGFREEYTHSRSDVALQGGAGWSSCVQVSCVLAIPRMR